MTLHDALSSELAPATPGEAALKCCKSGVLLLGKCKSTAAMGISEKSLLSSHTYTSEEAEMSFPPLLFSAFRQCLAFAFPLCVCSFLLTSPGQGMDWIYRG